MADRIDVSRDIAAPAEHVWAMVSDITRMGEWSPENEGGTWLGGATRAEAGAKFRGTNRNGKRTWTTVATVVDAEPGKHFSFRVSAKGLKVAEWSYSFEPTATGCRVTETWVDQRSGWFKPLAQLATGVSDRAARNRDGMEQTLERLAEAAEAGATPS
ncbi:MAG TPA: SRPBCC family protein [Acidimicrobiia bacterium]|nr:SRPBCC family protein [Acidimicrobiia bacterium]